MNAPTPEETVRPEGTAAPAAPRSPAGPNLPAQLDPRLPLLLEEWKQNVALYMDQDKRGFARVGVFLTVQAGLLALFGLLLKDGLPAQEALLASMTAAAALFLTVVTWLMARGAHAFILLRIIQARLIEGAIRGIVAPGAQGWPMSKGLITTFTRERAAFKRKRQRREHPEWQELIDEVDKTLGEEEANALRLNGKWRWSITHLRWVHLVFWMLLVFWICGLLLTLCWLAEIREIWWEILVPRY